MGKITLRPNSWHSPSINDRWKDETGAVIPDLPTPTTKLADDLDTTYAYLELATYDWFYVDFEDITGLLPNRAQIRSVQLRYRASLPDYVAGDTTVYSGFLGDTENATGSLKDNVGYLTIGTEIRTHTGHDRATDRGFPWDMLRVNNMRLRFQYNTGTLKTLRLYEVFADVYTNEAPIVSNVQPTTEQITSRPTVTWSYSDPGAVDWPENDPQERYQVKIFTQAQYEHIEFDEHQSPAFWDSGEVISGQQQAQVAIDLPNGTYRAYVRAADAGSNARYGAYAFSTFTVNVVPPPVPDLVVTPEPNLARYRLDITGGEYTLADQLFVVQRSLDNGATWEAIRGGDEVEPGPAPPASPVWQSATMGQANSNTVNVAKPADTGVGDVLVAHVMADVNSSGLTATGWTLIAPFIVGGDASQRLRILYRVIDGSEGANFTFTHTTSGAWISVVISRFTGVNTDTPVAVFGGDGGNSTTPTAPSLTATDDNSLLLWFYTGVGDVTVTSPPGMNERYENYFANIGFELALATEAVATGATGTRVGTRGSSGVWGATAVILNPGTPLDANTLYDYEAARDGAVQYRASAIAYLPDGRVASDYDTVTPGALTTDGWWLKDPVDPSKNTRIKAESFSFQQKEPQMVYEPLGRSDSVVVSDGVKGITGTLTLWAMNRDAYARLRALLQTGRPLWLEDELGRAWFVKFGATHSYELIRAAPVSSEVSRIRHFHSVQLPFTEVAAPIGDPVWAEPADPSTYEY